MLKAVLLDDELRGSKLLQKKLELYSDELHVLAVFNNAYQALEQISDLEPDVLFLDVEMPGLNGFEFLEKLGAFEFEVIFVTAYDVYTIDALRVAALDYLLKPVDEDELKTALQRLQERVAKKKKLKPVLPTTGSINGSRIALPTAEGVYLVKKADIIRIEAMNNYSTFFLTENKKIMISKTLKEYEQTLTDAQFFRVNRSCIVNLEYVIKYRKGDGGTLELSDGKEIEVSAQRKEELIQRIF
jgi:two-component system, LytTR family, response regulator